MFPEGGLVIAPFVIAFYTVKADIDEFGAVRGGADERGGHVVQYQRGFEGIEQLVSFIVVPTPVAEFHGQSPAGACGPDLFEQLFQGGDLYAGDAGRKLDKEAAFFSAEIGGGLHEEGDVGGAESKASGVGDIPPKLYRELEIFGYQMGPFGKGDGQRRFVKAAVDLDGIEEGGVIGETGFLFVFIREGLFVGFTKDEPAGTCSECSVIGRHRLGQFIKGDLRNLNTTGGRVRYRPGEDAAAAK